MRTKRSEKFVTIKDVAKKAGVSIATVSRVINNGNVKLDKRKKILKAIADLNYVPNSSARNLASVSKTKRITLIIPDISTYYYSEVIKGFTEIVKIYKYDPIIESFNYEEELYKKINEKYEVSSEVKGVIQLGINKKLENKIVINWDNEYLNFEVKKEKKIGIYTNDKYIKSFINSNIYKNIKDYQGKDTFDKYLAPSLQEALYLYNEGIKKDIYTFGDVSQISKICPNIKKMNIDFYALGVALARITMKKINNEEIVKINIMSK
ncbi:MAG: LacI family DNA-binding transcriptional regulator [Mycoplasmatales bacterium]